MSKTGGGHRASAQALQAGFEHLYPGVFEIKVIDLLMDYLPWPVREAPRSYDFISSKTPWLWKLLYEASDEALTALDSTAGRALSRSVERAFTQNRPDIVVSVHPLAQHVSIRALERLQMQIPFVTVITDLATLHPAWFHRQADLCFVPTEEARVSASERGLRPNRVHQHGLPLRPAFADLPERGPALREQLQIDTRLRAVLVYGGGESFSKVTTIVEALDNHFGRATNPLGQIVVITGQDGTLQPALEAREWSVPLRSLGVVQNMHEWMTACDCIVAKAGPGAIAESMVCSLPMMLSAYIPGQEAGNVPFVVDHGIGAYSEDPMTIASTVARWFGPGADERKTLSERAAEMSKPRATYDIVNDIAKLINSP